MDWYTIYGVDDEQAEQLTRLDTLRQHNPVTWGLIQGNKTSEAIAKLICWPHEYVLGQLRQLKRDGWVWDTEGPRQIHWHLTEEQSKDYLELRSWVYAQRQPRGLFRRNEDEQE